MAGAATPLSVHIGIGRWPSTPASREAAISWLASHGVCITLDLVELGQVSALPGAEAFSAEALAFLQKEVDSLTASHQPGAPVVEAHPKRHKSRYGFVAIVISCSRSPCFCQHAGGEGN